MRPKPDQAVESVNKRIARLSTVMANMNLPHDAAVRLDKHRQRLETARKILTKEKK